MKAQIQVIIGKNRKTMVLVDDQMIYESENSIETEKKNIQKLIEALEPNGDPDEEVH